MFNNKIIATFKLLLLVAAVFTISIIVSQGTPYVHAAKQNDKYIELENFSEVFNIIKSNYVDNVSDNTIIQGAIKGMLQELDPHSTYYSAENYKTFLTDMKGEFGGLGMTVGMRDGAVVVIAPIEDTPAYKAGLKAGDIIYMIDDVSTQGMFTDEAVKLMRGKPGTKVKLTIIRSNEDKPLEFVITRDIIKVKSVKYEMLPDQIAYVKLTSFQEKCGNEIQEALKIMNKQSPKGVILDLRSNPGGSLAEAVHVASIFLPANKSVVSTKSRTKNEVLTSINEAFFYRDVKRPLIILVNEGSASASEIVAGAIQDHKRGILLGTTTFGKASVQSLIELRNGAGMKLTTARYYTPNGRSIQGVGIVPDVVVPDGKIVYNDKAFSVKERDLARHLVGENEKDKVENLSSNKDDLQLQSAIQMIKGLVLYDGTK